MQALGGLRRFYGQRLELQGRVDEIAKNETSRVGLAIQEERRRFVEQSFGKLWIAPDALGNCLLEVPVSAMPIAL